MDIVSPKTGFSVQMKVKQIHSRVFARFVMSVLLCAWTNVFAQPCLMPMESVADAPAIDHGHMSHELHATDSGSENLCGHCASADEGASRLCAAGLNASCGESVESGPDNRKGESNFKVSINPVAMHTNSGTGSLSRSDPPAAPVSTTLLKYDSAPSPSIQFCVFLK